MSTTKDQNRRMKDLIFSVLYFYPYKGSIIPESTDGKKQFTENVKNNASQFDSHANQRLAGEKLGDCRADAV